MVEIRRFLAGVSTLPLAFAAECRYRWADKTVAGACVPPLNAGWCGR
jgi:hypothetical protein